MHAPLEKNKLFDMVLLARKHHQEGGLGAAGVYYRMILKETSPPITGAQRLAHGEACVWYARFARSKGRLGEAADWYNQALNADPLATEIYTEYVLKCLLVMGMRRDAKIYAERAKKIDPDSKDALRLNGYVEHLIGDVAASAAAFDRQLELYPDDIDAVLDRTTLALDTADYETVRRLCTPLLESNRKADAYHCLAMAKYREGKHEEALEFFDKAISNECFDTALAHWNKSLALQSIGRYREGWAEHEYRGKQITDTSMALIMKRFTLPRWQGEPPPARLHLHQEMGLGDTLAMARYAPMLAEQGYDVRLEVNDSLVSLFTRSFPNVKVMPKAIDYPAAFGVDLFDYHCPMLSLPAVMKTDIDTVPWNGAYLIADPGLVHLPDGRKIGLCWSSGIRKDGLWISEYGKRKSMHFDTLCPVVLVDNPGIKFVNLQVGPEREQHAGVLLDVLPEKPTWDDTAAVVASLDLVITVDTSVAHLAGAMGKPVWLMMHTEGSWHWMAPRPGAPWNERSPWYPSVRIFRQDKPGDWSSVISRVAEGLRKCPL